MVSDVDASRGDPLDLHLGAVAGRMVGNVRARQTGTPIFPNYPI